MDLEEIRCRVRDINLQPGIFPPGKLFAITDVPGVKVSQITLVSGEGMLVPGKGPIRTGVTVILPHNNIDLLQRFGHSEVKLPDEQAPGRANETF